MLFSQLTSHVSHAAIMVPQAVSYGRTPGYNAGTTADYMVDSSVASSSGTTFKTLSEMTTAVNALAGTNAINVLVRDRGTKYYEKISLTRQNVRLAGYGTEQPKLSGGKNVTGWTRCTSSDQAVVGTNYASIFKASVQKSNIEHSAYYAMLLTEADDFLTLVTKRADESDLFDITNSRAFYNSGTEGNIFQTVTKRVPQTITKGAADGIDSLGTNGESVSAIVAVNQGGTWDTGTNSFIGGTTYSATTDYVISGTTGISWAAAGAEPATGTTYTAVFDQDVLDTITHPAVLGNGTTPFTDTQLANCSVAFVRTPNFTAISNVLSSNLGVIKLEQQHNPDTSSGQRYALLNILPYMVKGQWGYVDNGGTSIDLYVWPNNEANLTSGIDIAVRTSVITVSGNGNTLENLDISHSCDDSFGLAAVIINGASNATLKECLIHHYSHADAGYGGVYAKNTNGQVIEKNDIEYGQNQYGSYVTKSAGVSQNNRVRYNRVYRTSQSPYRFFGQSKTAFYFNKADSCGLGAHANKFNFYEGSDMILVQGNVFINCGGYGTNQEASRMLIIHNYLPSDTGGDNSARAYCDQAHSGNSAQQAGSTGIDPSDNYFINNFCPFANGSTADVASVQLGGQYFSMGWYAYNNVCAGVSDAGGPANLKESDYNVLTFGSTRGANDISVSNALNLYYNPTVNDFTTVPNSVLRTKAGKDITSIIALYEGWFPDVNIRRDINGNPWNPALPGVGPYGSNWPIAVDTTAPTLSGLSATITGSTASCSISTSEKGGTIYWVRYNGGSIPSATQVIAGQNGSGTTALGSGNFSVLASGTQPSFSTIGTAGTTDTLAVVHKDRHANVSSVSTTSLAFAAYSPSWVATTGTTRLNRSTAGPLMGYQASTKAMLAAFTVQRNTTQLTTTTGTGGVLSPISTSDKIPSWGAGQTSKMSISQEDITPPLGASIANQAVPSVNMIADVQYLFILGFTSDAVNGRKFTSVCVKISDGTIVGTSPVTTGADTSIVFNHKYEIFKTAFEGVERFMLWDNAYLDPTSSATQQLFVGASGGLKDPAVAVTAVGTPIVNLYSGGLTNGANAGYGGDFDFN